MKTEYLIVNMSMYWAKLTY